MDSDTVVLAGIEEHQECNEKRREWGRNVQVNTYARHDSNYVIGVETQG